MPPELSIVKVDKRPYRTIAQENWGLTKEQMKGRHVHHRIPVSDGGTNDPTNLYVCIGEYHDIVWHGGEEFTRWASKGGKIGGKIGGKKSAELGVGAHAPGKRSEGGKKSAELGVGAHAPEMRGVGGRKSAELGVGIHAPGMQSEGGKKSGRKAAELGVGIHGRTPEQKAEDGSKGAKTTNSQKWQNTDPNYPPHLSTAAGLSHWQKARGIDTSMRVKLKGVEPSPQQQG